MINKTNNKLLRNMLCFLCGKSEVEAETEVLNNAETCELMNIILNISQW